MTTTATVEYAGFWRRFGAFMIDGMILGLVSMIFKMFGFGSTGMGALLALLYQPFFESSELQATPGKALLNMRVTDMNGQRITIKRAAIRYVMRLLSILFACIGFLVMLFTEKRQTFHDLVAETLVVRGEVTNVHYLKAWYNQVLAVLNLAEKNASGKSSEPPANSYTGGDPGAKADPADFAALYELYQKGFLTEAEYQHKREELLKRL